MVPNTRSSCRRNQMPPHSPTCGSEPPRSEAHPNPFAVTWGLGNGAWVIICLDKYIPDAVYKECGVCVRNHCGAEPPGDLEPPGLVTTVGWRDRASTSYAAADRVQAPA